MNGWTLFTFFPLFPLAFDHHCSHKKRHQEERYDDTDDHPIAGSWRLENFSETFRTVYSTKLLHELILKQTV